MPKRIPSRTKLPQKKGGLRISLQSSSLGLGLSLIFTTLMNVWPTIFAWLPLIAGVLVILLDIRFERGGLEVGNPTSAYAKFLRLDRWKQVGILLGLVVAIGWGTYTYFRSQYVLRYQVCRGFESIVVGDTVLIDKVGVGIRLLNENSFEIKTKVRSASLTLGGDASEGGLVGRELPLPSDSADAYLTDYVDLEPNILTADEAKGQTKYVIEYGRLGGPLNKRLLVEGEITADFDYDGSGVRLNYTPTEESIEGYNSQTCAIPIPG